MSSSNFCSFQRLTLGVELRLQDDWAYNPISEHERVKRASSVLHLPEKAGRLAQPHGGAIAAGSLATRHGFWGEDGLRDAKVIWSLL